MKLLLYLFKDFNYRYEIWWKDAQYHEHGYAGLFFVRPRNFEIFHDRLGPGRWLIWGDVRKWHYGLNLAAWMGLLFPYVMLLFQMAGRGCCRSLWTSCFIIYYFNENFFVNGKFNENNSTDLNKSSSAFFRRRYERVIWFRIITQVSWRWPVYAIYDVTHQWTLSRRHVWLVKIKFGRIYHGHYIIHIRQIWSLFCLYAY